MKHWPETNSSCLGAVTVSGTGLSTLQALSCLILTKSDEVGAMIIPILQMWITVSLEGLGNLLKFIHLLCSFRIQPRPLGPSASSLSLCPRSRLDTTLWSGEGRSKGQLQEVAS